MGIDPVLEKIPEGNIVKFYSDILDAMEGEDVSIPTVKPNIAFFEQYGFEGLKALKEIIKKYKEKEISIILDAKRGDIGKTAEAYAESVFGFWQADAVTLHPYLGNDSITPFLEKGGAYVQVRNSNPSAKDMQDLKVNGNPLFKEVANMVAGKWYKPGIGAVVGATYPKELEELSTQFVSSGKQIPMLIPGVGSQGGSAEEVMTILKKTNNPLWLHRVNSSSGISYAYLKQDTDDYAGSAVKEIKRLNRVLRLK